MAEDGLPKNTCYSHDCKPSGYPHRSGFQIPPSTKLSTAAEKTLHVFVLIVTVIFFNFILAITFMFFFVPSSPDVNLISPSVVAHNVCSHYVNLDVGVVVKNNAIKGMLLKNITLWTYHGNDVLGAPVTLPSFELQGDERHTAGFKHRDMLIPIDEWESTAVGVSWVGFVVRFKIWYKGTAFSRKIAVKADCGTVKMRFNPASTSSNASTQIENFDTATCFVLGLWDHLLDAVHTYMFCSTLAIVIIGAWLGRSHLN